jgi:glutathione synthase/RimK-type ligase-like ATP-grasp enzyme
MLQTTGEMQFALIAHHETETNLRLVEAAPAGVETTLMSPADTLGRLRPGDAALARLDVLPTLDGIEPGTWELARLEAEGVRMLNRLRTLLVMHDKLLTARLLSTAGLPHPKTRHLTHPRIPSALEPPFVLKPRFGSWGADVHRCRNRASAMRRLELLSARGW